MSLGISREEQHMRGDKISQAEMIEMFGEAMPLAAVNLLWNSPGEMTVGEMRAELRKIAAEGNPMTNTREERVDRIEQLLVDAYRRGFDEGAESALEEGETPHKDTKNEGSGIYRQEAEKRAAEIVEPSPDVWEATQDTGASATPSSSRASTEPVPVSAASGFDPSRRLEFRPDEEGVFDELVATFADGGVFIETMSDQGVYVDFQWDDGLHCQLWITCGGKAKLRYHHDHSHGDPPRYTAQGVDTKPHLPRPIIDIPRPAIATGTATTTEIGVVHEGAGPQGHRPPTGQVTVEEDRA